MGWETTWEATLGDNSGGGKDQNFRNILAAATLTTSGSQVRITIKGHSSTAGQIDGASIGLRDGSTEDFDGAPTRILFSGETYGVIPVGGTLVSDAVNFELNEANDYLVHLWMDDDHFYVSACSTGSDSDYQGTYDGGVDDTLTEDISYTFKSGDSHGLSKVEVEVVSDLSIDVSECE